VSLRAALVAALILPAAAVPAAGLPPAVVEIAGLLPGSYASRDAGATVRFAAAAVPKSRIAADAPVFYVEAARAARPDAPFLQRFLALESDGSRVAVRVYEPRDLAGVRGKWREPEALALFTPRDVRERPDCRMTLAKTPAGDWAGGTAGETCFSAAADARLAVAMSLSPQTLEWREEGKNAAGKARYYSRHAPGPLFADDSGLEVRALGGAPGVYSSRFSGPGATDESNNRLLLEKLRGVEDRAAQFVCVVALAAHGRLIQTFRGVVEGRIIDQARGRDGFGYDPLFYYRPFDSTFGEIPGQRKQDVSHRGRALAAMMEYLNELTSSGATREDVLTLIKLVAPFAPHLGDEAWEKLGQQGFLLQAAWPSYDEALTIDAVVTLGVQVNGKLRGDVQIARDAPEAEVRAKAMAVPNVAKHLEGKTVRKVIVVAGKIVNIVVS